MEKLTIKETREINGGATENQNEFFEWGRQLGKSTREALATIGTFLLFKR